MLPKTFPENFGLNSNNGTLKDKCLVDSYRSYCTKSKVGMRPHHLLYRCAQVYYGKANIPVQTRTNFMSGICHFIFPVHRIIMLHHSEQNIILQVTQSDILR